MNRLIDKLAMISVCIVGFAFSEELTEPVICLLLSVGVSLTVQLYTGRRIASVMLFITACSCIFYPLMLLAVPILLYDALWEGRPWLEAPALLAIGRAAELSTPQLLIIMAGVLIAVLIYIRVSSLEKSVRILVALRDEVEGKNLQLADKNSRLAEAQDNEVRLATLRERNRIAREIHDNVGHMLTRSILQSGALIIINKDEKLSGPLQDLKETLNTAMTSIRESVHDLHDDSIDLDAIVKETLRGVSDRFSVEYSNEAEHELPVKVRLCFIAVVKEAVSNTVKHSSGSSIRVVIRENASFYQLSAEDNGSCADIDITASDGIGLQNMRDRAASVNGMISFAPTQQGFRINLSVPRDGV